MITKETEAELATLRAKQAEFLARVKARGGNVLEFTAPCCGGKQETHAPTTPIEPGERPWSSMATCTNCGAMYMKNTYHDHVAAAIPPELEKA